MYDYTVLKQCCRKGIVCVNLKYDLQPQLKKITKRDILFCLVPFSHSEYLISSFLWAVHCHVYCNIMGGPL